MEKAATKPTASGGKTRTPANTPRQLISRWYGLLFSDDVYQRMAGFLLWGLVIIAVTWAVAFFCLPDGLLENTMIVKKLFGVKGSTRPGEWGLKWLGETAKIFGREFTVGAVTVERKEQGGSVLGIENQVKRDAVGGIEFALCDEILLPT